MRPGPHPEPNLGTLLAAVLRVWPARRPRKRAQVGWGLRRYRGRVAGAQLRVHLLGGFAVSVDGRTLPATAWRQRRPAELLALLVLSPGRSMPRDQVIEALWPGLGPAAGAANLRKAAFHLRQLLGVPEVCVLEGRRVGLLPDGEVRADVDDFEARAREALASGDPARCREAAGYYGGPLLPEDPYAAWAEEHRARLQRLYLELLEAGEMWGRLVAEDPTREVAHQELMRQHLVRGDRAAAIRQFGRAREVLREELGVSPGAELTGLYEEALEAEGRAAATPAMRARALLMWGGVHYERAELAEAERGLGRGILDGILVIRKGYEEGLIDLHRPRVDYLQAAGSLATSIVQETVAAAVLPEFTRASLSQRLADLYDRTGRSVPEGLQQRFDSTQRTYAETIAKFEVVYHSRIDTTPTVTLVVSDYSMEVFFLSVYAVAGTIALSAGELRKRLASTAHGLALDYAATLSVLYLLGLVQILCYTGAMRLLMGSPFVPGHVGTLAVYLLLMLGLGQLTVLFDAGDGVPGVVEHRTADGVARLRALTVRRTLSRCSRARFSPARYLPDRGDVM